MYLKIEPADLKIQVLNFRSIQPSCQNETRKYLEFKIPIVGQTTYTFSTAKNETLCKCLFEIAEDRFLI